MPSLRKVGTKVRYSIERFDGGRNTKYNPSTISPFDSPEEQNNIFTDAGGFQTRPGSLVWNTTAIGSHVIDGMVTYNGSQIVWAGGSMYRASQATNGSGVGVLSNVTYVTVPSAQSMYNPGAKVAHVVYQGVLFSSDGSTNSYKYTDENSFHYMGIGVPSTVTGVSSASNTCMATGLYYYACSFVNSQAVEGQIGSITAAVSLSVSGAVQLSSIPVGTSLQGVNARRIYRASTPTSTFQRIATISDNTTTTYLDVTPNGSEGVAAITDAGSPPPFNTIVLAGERLFMDDASTTDTIVRWTEFENPYSTLAENFEPINNRDGEDVIAVGSQDNLVTIWKENNFWSLYLQDPSDDTTWVLEKSPANVGIVGPRAFTNVENGIIFIGRQNQKITGFHYMSANQILETTDGKLRTINISDKIQYDILSLWREALLEDISMTIYKNKLLTSVPGLSSSARNDTIYWFDLAKFGAGTEPGPYSKWTGLNISCFSIFEGELFGGLSTADGKVIKLYQEDYYTDFDGSAIDAYYWTKEIGGSESGELDSYIKDFRELYVWHAKLGNYDMNVRWRTDGDTSVGVPYAVSLANVGSLWGTLVWGSGTWSGTRRDFETRIPIGRLTGRRLQLRVDNQNTAGQGYRVNRMELGMNIRRSR